MENKACDHESKKSSRKAADEVEISIIRKESYVRGEDEHDDNLRSRSDDHQTAENGEDFVVINMGSENSMEEKVCRICHFGSEEETSSSQLLELGCDCKGELGSCHRHCAEAWFTQKGNRLCEICGKMAKNISTMSRTAEDMSMSAMEWNEMRLVVATLDPDLERSRRCKHFCLHFLLICLILLFVLPWLFRGMNVF